MGILNIHATLRKAQPPNGSDTDRLLYNECVERLRKTQYPMLQGIKFYSLVTISHLTNFQG